MTSIKQVFLLVSLLLLCGCARNYVTRRTELHLIGQKTEVDIGAKAKEEIIKEYGVYKDLSWQIYIDQVGQRLVKVSDRPNLAYDFTIIDSDILNAFAVPGGYVFITRGLLAQMADEAELAIVLGHEITHIAAWHGIETLQRAGILSTLTTLGAIGGIAVGAGEAALVIAQAANIYSNMYLMGYGRDHELEADRYGILYAYRAGYDPEAAYTLFDRLQQVEKEEEAGHHISPYWQSHPPADARLKQARRWIAQAAAVPVKGGASLNYNRDKYQSMVERLPRGESAEKGAIRGSHYQNDVYGVSLDVPAGWRLDNSRIQSLVGFVGPVPEVRGTLQRSRLPQSMGVQEFGKQVARQWGLQKPVSKEADYPAGHGLLWQYGGDYRWYRTLLLVRGGVGYIVSCEMPSEQFLQYIVDCEHIMRSLVIR